MTQKLRSLEVRHRSSNQDKNTAESEKQKRLSFKPHLFIMMIETLSGTILLINFHLTLSTRQNQILPLFLILYFRKKGGNCRRHSCTCRRCTCTCTCTCTHTGDSWKMTTHSRKSTRQNFGKPTSAHSDSYIQTLSRPGLVDTQYNVGLYEQL